MSQPGQSVVPVGQVPVNTVQIQTGVSDSLCEALRLYDWTGDPERVLGWAMAQREIDLCTALEVFFNGQPTRFNYLPKRDVPCDYLGVTRALDNICLRINSGYYLAYPGQRPRCQTRLDHWLRYQAADRAEGRSGRWVLDERILDALRPSVPTKRVVTTEVSPSMPGKWWLLGRPLGGVSLLGWLSRR